MLVVVAEHHLELGPAQPADAVGRREHVVRVDERAAAVELSVVHEPRHPRVPVDASHLSAHDPRLLVDHSAICEKFIHTFIYATPFTVAAIAVKENMTGDKKNQLSQRRSLNVASRFPKKLIKNGALILIMQFG
jgi:hypothetical protein